MSWGSLKLRYKGGGDGEVGTASKACCRAGVRHHVGDEVARIERDDFAVAIVGLTLDEGKRLAAATPAATTESTVQRLLHRRMSANQPMRWSPRGAHLMLKFRTAVVNGTFNTDHTTTERWARRPFHHAA